MREAEYSKHQQDRWLDGQIHGIYLWIVACVYDECMMSGTGKVECSICICTGSLATQDGRRLAVGSYLLLCMVSRYNTSVSTSVYT